ncbi:zinc finger protein 800 isoform X2 [Diachasmimorpha longicaudata]
MKAKSKSKRSVRKFSRLKINPKEESPSNDDGIDLSSLRKPITTSLSSLRQVAKLFDNGNHEVTSILDYECEVIYECRICRSLFRSLANFISHKRVYCTAKFDISMDRSAIDPLGMPILIPNITPPPSSDTESKENCKAERSKGNPLDTFSRKDLTSVVAMLQQKQAETDPHRRPPSPLRIVADTEQVLLEVLESNKVAYQTVLEPTHSHIDSTDLMKAQANEVQSILSRNTAVLGPDGQLIEVNHLEKPDSPLQFHDHPEDSLSSTSSGDTNLVCSVCDAKFATKKTLTFHMKSLHTPHRMVYPCPCCESLFTNPWGVYRHLYKIHRKSNDQVRKLRPQIQEKAYRTEATRAQDIEKDCANSKLNNNHEVTINETEEWMAHLERDGELQRCGGCGKRFDRKAALLSHSQICQKRIAACSDGAARARRQQKASEIILETSISAPITSGRLPVSEGSVSVKDIIPKVVKDQKDEVIRLPNLSSAVTLTRLGQDSDIGIRVEGVSSLSKDAWDKIGNDGRAVEETVGEALGNAEVLEMNGVQGDVEMDDDPEIIFTKIEKNQETPVDNVDSKKRKSAARGDRQQNSNSSLLKRSKTPSLKGRSAPPETTRPVSSRVKAIERRIATIADLPKLRCLPCNKKFSSMAHLRRHMAIHITWNRYRCNLCGFKCYEKVDCVAHCNMAHDAKNNRSAIAGMMAEIQPDDNNANAAGRSLLKKQQGQTKEAMDLEVIDVTKPKTTFDDIANANEEIDCIQNGDVHGDKAASSPNSENRSEDSSERSKRAKLDEDPELRRMVMEVIFGSSEGSSSSSEQSFNSSATPKALERGISIERSASSSPTSIEAGNPSPKTIESPKNEDKVQRPTRNRSKVIDKDFIYDLDAVLMQEPVMMEKLSHGPETSLKVTNDKKRNSIDITDFKGSDDLTVVLYTGDDGNSKIQEITKTNIIVGDK